MEFKFITRYDQKATTAMARALRKTVRKKKNKRSRVFGWLVVGLAILLLLTSGEEGFVLDRRSIVTMLVVGVMVLTLLFEDQMNGYFARKRMLPGTEMAEFVFKEENYHSVTKIGKTEWMYELIVALAENKEYFVFVFSDHHAQVYEKSGLSGGTVTEFRQFIETRTGKTVVKM